MLFQVLSSHRLSRNFYKDVVNDIYVCESITLKDLLAMLRSTLESQNTNSEPVTLTFTSQRTTK